MSNLMIILIGGVAPAFLWGITAIFQKQSAVHGAHPGLYLVLFGLMTALVGFAGLLLAREFVWVKLGSMHAALAGLTFALGSGLISFALWRYGAPISKLAPILSCAVLVTVAASAIFLDEAARLNFPQLLIGTLLIVGGAILVTNA
jgi:uncharacterized membrane protein